MNDQHVGRPAHDREAQADQDVEGGGFHPDDGRQTTEDG
jgi:hypothetical protein